MSIDAKTLALAKKYTNDTAEEFGAVKGASCQIQSIVDNGDGSHTVTFVWVNSSGVSRTSEMIVLDGVEGPQGIQGIQGEKGDPGFSPVIEVYQNTGSTYILQITTETETFLTPNLKGGGSGGTDDYRDLDFKPQINGTELVGDLSFEDLGLSPLTDTQMTTLLNYI